jgi:type II secretory pathway pseudopilin PulG
MLGSGMTERRKRIDSFSNSRDSRDGRRSGGLSQASGLSLIEVLFAMAVLLIGVVAIANVFPSAIRAKQDAGYYVKAVLLAQTKAHEVRRDNNTSNTLISSIQNLTAPTTPIAFPDEPNLAYQFCGVSLEDPIDEPGHPDSDPRDDPGVARVIVRYAASYRKSQEIIYELRFGR